MDIIKSQHGAGGFVLSLTNGNGNTKFGDRKKKVIIKALQDSDTEGVYITDKGAVKRQLLNGVSQFI